MLEKLAEMVREQVEEVVVGGKSYYSLCYLCEFEPANRAFPRCMAAEAECLEARRRRDLMLARWAVLLVAKGLEKECKGYQGETAKDAFVRDTAIMLLIAEANTNVYSGEEQMCKAKEE